MSSETVVSICKNLDFQSQNHVLWSITYIDFRILHAIFCFVLLSTSLLYNANVASSSVAYHKRRLKLFAAALTTTELMSAYYKCIYKHKMIFGTDHAVATDTSRKIAKY